MKEIDTLIVGQGIAGSILAFRCVKRGESVVVIDPAGPSASTRSFGLINPITGRKYVKSWMIEKLIEESIQTYQELGDFFEESFLEKIDIVRVFNDGLEEEFWMLRNGEPGYEKYLSDDHFPDLKDVFKEDPAHGIVKGGYQAMLGRVVIRIREWLVEKESFIQELFEHNQLKFQENRWVYKEISAHKIIFCEGAGLLQNPFFEGLPVFLNKGDMLILDVPNYPPKLIVKNKYFSIPISGSMLWFGVVNSWTDMDPSPNEQAKNDLIAEWEKRYALPMTVQKHLTAFRLAVKDRRPLIGQHRTHKNMYIFTGMGTKGGSLVPYFAKMLLGWINQECELADNVNYRRFNK